MKQAWEHVILHHLQPNDCLNRDIHIEIRNDNDKRFSAGSVKEYFKENQLVQVFTHPYTPQENGHIESFHAIMSNHFREREFWSLKELQEDLILFAEKYNNVRIHASIDYVSPNEFWSQHSNGNIIAYCKIKKREFVLKLKDRSLIEKEGFQANEPEGWMSKIDYPDRDSI